MAQNGTSDDEAIGWLEQAVAAERKGKARGGHLATLELLLATRLAATDRKL